MRNKIFLRCLAASLLVLSSNTFADEISNAKVTRISTEIARSEVSFWTDKNADGCNYGVIRYSLSTEGGKAAYSQMLSAQVVGRSIQKITYTNSNGSCVMTFIES